jgi:hypothetical protein
VTPGARGSAALAALLCALAAAAPAGAQTAQSQTFFKARLLAEPQTSKAIKDLLRTGGGFVDRSVVFRDLTSDKRDDAIVRVHSGGAAGVVAVYVFSTDARRAGSPLRSIYRSQRLLRASTQVSRGVLSFRSSSYVAGDEVCCPTHLEETTLRWDRKRKRFTSERKTIDREPVAQAPSAPSPPPSPTP